MDTQRAHALVTAMKFRLELWSSFQVSDLLEHQAALVTELEAKIEQLEKRNRAEV